MELSKEEKFYVWLDAFPLEESVKRRLELAARTPQGHSFSAAKEFLRSAIESEGKSVYMNMAESLSDGGERFGKIAERLKREGVFPVSRASRFYPEELKELDDAPPVLYAKGNVALLRERKFTAVGSRRTPSPALKLTEKICGELSRAFVVVSGAAEGGDSAAISGALAGSGRAISVLAGGFSSIPQGNLRLLGRVAEKGLLIAPHSFDTPVRNFSYGRRNKLLAALGEGTLVVGAGEKSGALITAEYARKMGRPVFAIPYPPAAAGGVGCNALIKKGAYLTENSVDISGRFGINLIESEKTPDLSAEETATLFTLRELSEAHVGEISAKAGLPVYRTSVILSSLEVKGLVARTGGNRYVAV